MDVPKFAVSDFNAPDAIPGHPYASGASVAYGQAAPSDGQRSFGVTEPTYPIAQPEAIPVYPVYQMYPAYSPYMQTGPFQPIQAVPENTVLTLPPLTPGTPPKWYISALLTRLGFPARLSGFYYLPYALMYLLNLPEGTHKLNLELYPYLARECHTTQLAVSHAMRHAINQMWQEPNITAYCSLLGRNASPYEPKPTTSEFLANLIVFLRMQLSQYRR